MEQVYKLDINQIKDFLLSVGTKRPIFIWGSPGIGKSSVVEQFADSVGLECVTLLGSQLAPEDLIGIPQITKNEHGQAVSRFIPPSMIVRNEPFVLFLDELNLASSEVRKAFYSLILDKRIGEYKLPEGSVIIGAGNRASDSALVSQLPSALISRMVHVTMKISPKIWLRWAEEKGIHPYVIEYIKTRPTHLGTEIAPADETVFSTPRTWEYVSDIIHAYNGNLSDDLWKVSLQGCITKEHAVAFMGFVKLNEEKYKLPAIIDGKEKWPSDVSKRDILMFLVESFRDYLHKELPKNDGDLNSSKKNHVHKIKLAVQGLAEVDKELVNLIIAPKENNEMLPSWFLMEVGKSGITSLKFEETV